MHHLLTAVVFSPLLGAVALGRTWFGITLVLAYGVGIARPDKAAMAISTFVFAGGAGAAPMRAIATNAAPTAAIFFKDAVTVALAFKVYPATDRWIAWWERRASPDIPDRTATATPPCR